MTIEAALIKPVVDALLSLFRQGEHIKLKRNAEAALHDAIHELLLVHPDENKAQAKIAIARAAGILSEDIVLAEDMLEKHRASRTRTAGKASTGRKRKPAAESRTEPSARKQAEVDGDKVILTKSIITKPTATKPFAAKRIVTKSIAAKSIAAAPAIANNTTTKSSAISINAPVTSKANAGKQSRKPPTT